MPIHLKIGPNWSHRQCCLAGSSKTAPRILIFSIAMGAENLSCVKSIETQARTFLPLNISAISSVTHCLRINYYVQKIDPLVMTSVTN